MASDPEGSAGAKQLSLKQSAFGYLAFAWVIVQVIDILGESWGVGQVWAQRVQVGLVIGFIPVVALAFLLERRSGAPSAPRKRQHPVLAATGWVLAVLLVGSLVFTARSSDRSTWARNEAIPQAQAMLEQGNYVGALSLSLSAAEHLTEDPVLYALIDEASSVVSVVVEPEGASVFVKEYAAPDSEWRLLGSAPLQNLRLPNGTKQWRIELTGYETRLLVPPALGDLSTQLLAEGTSPEGMVPVPEGLSAGWTRETGAAVITTLPAHFYDRFEVTSAEFMMFAGNGGYEDEEIWRGLTSEGLQPTARARFVDATGRPGPSNWEVGTPPAGTEGLPVSGVSWYEAVAYCRWAGKSLPTLYHWSRSSGVFLTTGDVAPRSHFASTGPRPSTESRSPGAYGSFDLGGNVREWVWNRVGDRRLLLGGGWDDPEYFFGHAQAYDPMDRSQGNGFRCVLESASDDTGTRLTDPVTLNNRDYFAETPVEESIYEVFKRRFAYDDLALDARIEDSGHTAEGFPYEVVSYSTPYEGSRGGALIVRPIGLTRAQAVVFYPGSDAPFAADVLAFVTRDDGTLAYDYLLRSGRALVVPMLKGTFARQDDREMSTWPSETNAYTEDATHWVQDVSRVLDYLESRDDIDAERIGYLGNSWGGRMGAVILAVENRFRAAVLLSGGLASGRSLPEVDQINFIGRVTLPVLMLNGLRDSVEPYETAQRPMFELLGTPRADKKHVTFPNTGHTLPRVPYVRETVSWLDTHLGRTGGA